jgi:hypothetical protein
VWASCLFPMMWCLATAIVTLSALLVRASPAPSAKSTAASPHERAVEVAVAVIQSNTPWAAIPPWATVVVVPHGHVGDCAAAASAQSAASRKAGVPIVSGCGADGVR